MTLEIFTSYSDRISALPEGTLTEGHLRQFLLSAQPPIEIFYAPFDWCNVAAKIVIVGITPGRNSMRLAFEAARDSLRSGGSLEEAVRRAKRTGSFSNMRKNLSSRLDAVGVNAVLGITSCSELFGERADLLHTTSAIRYPVFKDGKNYGGYSPSLTSHVLLKRFVHEYLTPEIAQFPKALFVPNGPAVAKALLMAGLDGRRCLVGFPHASNGPGAKDRAKTFEAEKGQMRKKVSEWGCS